MGAGASVPFEFSTLSPEKQTELKHTYDSVCHEAEDKQHLSSESAQKYAIDQMKTDYLSGEIAMNRPLTIPLVDLVKTIELAVSKGKTPLVIDSSEEDKVNSFYTYQSVVMLDGKKMGLDKSLKKIPVQDIMEDARAKLVQALKLGQPLVIALTKSVTDFAQTFTDEAASANGTLDMNQGKYFPLEVFKNAGRDLVRQEYLDALFRNHEKDQGFAVSRSPETFRVIITSQFLTEDFDEYLFGNDWGLPKPKDQYQVIIIDDSRKPIVIKEEAPPEPTPVQAAEEQHVDTYHDEVHAHSVKVTTEYHDSVKDHLDRLGRNDITELKSLVKPPATILPVMECLGVLFGTKTDWVSVKKILSDDLITKLKNFDKDHIPAKKMKKLLTYIEKPDFNPEVVKKSSAAAAGLCAWLIALAEYDKKARGH